MPRRTRKRGPNRPPFAFLNEAESQRSNFLKGQVQGHLQEAGASDGVLDYAQVTRRGADVGVGGGAVGLASFWKWGAVLWRVGEERVELHVVVGRVEARVVEDVKGLHIELQAEALGDLEIFEDGHVDTGLEGAAENVTAGRAKSGFVDVAHAGDWVARRNAVLAWLQERNAEGSGVEDGHAGVDAQRAL